MLTEHNSGADAAVLADLQSAQSDLVDLYEYGLTRQRCSSLNLRLHTSTLETWKNVVLVIFLFVIWSHNFLPKLGQF